MATAKEPSLFGNAHFILTIIMIIGFAVSAALWATNSHAEIKEWAINQDYVTKTDLKEIFKEQYVPISRFIKLETQMEETKRVNEKMLDTLQELTKKIDLWQKKR